MNSGIHFRFVSCTVGSEFEDISSVSCPLFQTEFCWLGFLPFPGWKPSYRKGNQGCWLRWLLHHFTGSGAWTGRSCLEGSWCLLFQTTSGLPLRSPLFFSVLWLCVSSSEMMHSSEKTLSLICLPVLYSWEHLQLLSYRVVEYCFFSVTGSFENSWLKLTYFLKFLKTYFC